MLSDTQLKERVKRRLAELDRSPIVAAEIGGLQRDYIRDWISPKGKKQSVKPAYYPKLAKGLNWTVDELLDQKRKNFHVAEVLPSPVDIPEIDLRAGVNYAGGFSQEEATVDASGAIISRDAVRANWGIPLPFLRDELHLHPGQVHILAVRGDSMMDALYDGDRAVIDLTDIDVSQGGIFALLDDVGSVIIKQVELVRGQHGRRILCKSRNPQYEPFELALDEPVRIIGRVACKITRL